MLRRIAPLLAGCLLALTACSAASAAAPYRVTIARTQFGIPHIRANDERSIGFGYAYAMANDVGCTVAESYITADGERSRFFGPDGSYSIRGNGSTANNLNSDFFYQRIRDRKIVEHLAEQPPPLGPKPEIKAALQGYVDGWNTWLHDVGGSDGVPDRTCRGKAWMRPITIWDVYRRFYALSLLASSGVAIDGIAGAQPLTGPADAMSIARSLTPGIVDERLGGLGSNAYAIGKDGSQDGHGLLYGNPHFPWQGSERFYQSHLTIPGRLDVTGGSLLGVPIINIGTTRGVAWSHTVSTARRFVPYQLSLVPGSPTSYVEDGVVKQMTSDKVTVMARNADGSLSPRTRTLWSSDHGPILTSILGLPVFPWTPLNAYAMYDANADNFGRLLNHFYDVNFAQSVDDIKAILAKYQGIPWVNTIAADTAGHAYYADIGSIPDIPKDKYTSCETPLGLVLDQAQRLPVLDGTRSDCKPGTEKDAVAPGILGLHQLPSLERDDDVSNMNDSYWLTNPAQPLEGYSRIIGDERTARSLRTRLGIMQLQQRLAGTDGLPGKGFTLDNLMQVGFGDRVLSAELWRDALVAGCSSQACAVLRGWNLRNDLDAKGALLWQRFMGHITGVAPVALPPVLVGYTTDFDPNDPVHTPRGLNPLDPVVVAALQQAVSDLQGAGLPLDATLRQGQTVTRRGEVIPIHGGPGPNGIFNVVTPVWDPKKGYTEIVHGSSFIQAVHLTPGCPELRTLLTYGESTDPDSVHTSDMTKEFSAKRWVKVPFCPKDLEADPSAVRVHMVDAGSTELALHEARGAARPRLTVDLARPATVVVRVRRGGRVIRRIARRGAHVAVSPRLPLGAYRVDVSIGRRTYRIGAKQR